jgi:kynureninase
MLRLAPAPLYTTFAECEAAVDVLEDLLRTRAYLDLPDRDDAVT